MTVDLLAAAFWPEAALLGAHPPHTDVPEPAPRGTGEVEDETARDEGFWAAVLRHLWAGPGASAVP